jgi:hypothetical protein
MDLCQPAAMELWPILAANKFQERQDQTTKTFCCCFRRGDPVSKYTAQLATAGRDVSSDQTGGTFSWTWVSTHDRNHYLVLGEVKYKGHLNSETAPAVIVEVTVLTLDAW